MGKLNLNDKLNNIKPYVVDKKQYSVKLDANESFLSFPEKLQEELKDSVTGVLFNRYPDPDAEELCRLYGNYCGVDSHYITAGNGSDEIIQTLCNGFLNHGEAILTIKPDFSMYKFYASLLGAYSIEYDMSEDLIFNREEFVKTAKNDDVKMIIFSTPNNPTGGVLSREDILYVVENCDALVVVDEAYFEFCGLTVIDKIFEYENLAVLRTCSKAFGLAALRVGFLVAGEKIISSVRKVKPPYNVSALSQAAASVMLKHMDIAADYAERIKVERDFLYNGLKRLEEEVGIDRFRVYPTYANFVYIKSDRAKEMYDKLKGMDIIVRFFGGNLRINAGSREENEKLLQAIRVII